MAYAFSIDRSDLLRTYIGDEVGAAEDYDRVMEHPVRTPAGIANALNLDVKKVQRYLNGSKPRGLSGIERLETFGLFPLDLHSENFSLFHLLSCTSYWRGLVASRNELDPTLANTIWTPTSPQQRAFMEALLEQAGIPYRPSSKGGLSLPNEVSRILFASGHVVGKKSGNEETVPKYIRGAVETYSERSSEAQLRLIRDFVNSMIFHRLKDYEHHSLVHLFTLQDRTHAQAQGNLIYNAVQIGLPGITAELHGPYTSEGTFHTRIAFTKDAIETVATVRNSYADRALESIQST